MKLIKKTSSIFGNNSGETMVEVLVAFTLLSIMLVAFSQGISWATNTVRSAFPMVSSIPGRPEMSKASEPEQ